MGFKENIAVDLSALREYSRTELIHLLSKLNGSKVLVLDPALSWPINLIADLNTLKENGVEKTTILKSEPLVLAPEQRQIMYLVRSKTSNMKIIADHIRNHLYTSSAKYEYFVCMVPQRTIMCEKILEEEGVHGNITVADFNLDLVPLNNDVMSMETADSLRECSLHGDMTSLFYVAKGLMKMQLLYGNFPVIKGKGHAAKAVADMLDELGQELGGEPAECGEPRFDELILIDREVDIVTPMVTPLTYEGLIDELYEMKNAIAPVPGTVLAHAQALYRAGGVTMPPDRPVKVKVALNAADPCFMQIRDLRATHVLPVIQRRQEFVKHVQENVTHSAQAYQSSSSALMVQLKRDLSLTDDEVHEYGKGVLQLNTDEEYRRAGLHLGIAKELSDTLGDLTFSRRVELERMVLEGRIAQEKALEYVEDVMYRQHDPFPKVVRLLCLMSFVYDGIKNYDHYKRELLHVYGFEHMFAITNLERIGMLKKSSENIATALLAGAAGATGTQTTSSAWRSAPSW
mmetsp:Transcript_710/g.1667  ORF Transcript_710/g.1667 Transcript_710/m.1667 type:complete len:516 (+) Transcript_710:67-1614(+)